MFRLTNTRRFFTRLRKSERESASQPIDRRAVFPALRLSQPTELSFTSCFSFSSHILSLSLSLSFLFIVFDLVAFDANKPLIYFYHHNLCTLIHTNRIFLCRQKHHFRLRFSFTRITNGSFCAFTLLPLRSPSVLLQSRVQFIKSKTLISIRFSIKDQAIASHSIYSLPLDCLIFINTLIRHHFPPERS
jgi:hypothetical protein